MFTVCKQGEFENSIQQRFFPKQQEISRNFHIFLKTQKRVDDVENKNKKISLVCMKVIIKQLRMNHEKLSNVIQNLNTKMHLPNNFIDAWL